MDNFKNKKQFHYFTWHCFTSYVLLGYFIGIPALAEPSWLKINQTMHKYQISANWLHVLFATGAILSTAIDFKGTSRQALIKCNTILVVVLALQWFLPFREGTLIIRLFVGLYVSLDIRYSNIYYGQIIRPIEKFVRQKFPKDSIGFGQQMYSKQVLFFGIGWFWQGLMSISYPQPEMLQKLRMYDDTLLWNLLISMPCVLLAIRLINLHLGFNYDELKTINEQQAEYFVANMLKQKYMDDAIEMYHANQLSDGNTELEISDNTTFRYLQVIQSTSGLMMIVLFPQKSRLSSQITPSAIMLLALVFSLTVYLAQRKLQIYPIHYRRSLFLSLISQIVFIIGNHYLIDQLIILSSFAIIISNALGMQLYINSLNYYDDDMKMNQIVQYLCLLLMAILSFSLNFGIFVIGSLLSLVLCIMTWRRVSGLLETSEENEEDTAELMRE